MAHGKYSRSLQCSIANTHKNSCDHFKDGRCTHPKVEGDKCNHHVLDCQYWENTAYN